MKLLLLVFTTTVLSANAQNKAADQFTLNGAIEHSQTPFVYLRYIDIEGKSVFDSATIENGRFHFTGKISEPTQAILKANREVIPDDENPNILFFFLEPSAMEVSVSYNEFSKALVKGSKTQDEVSILAIYERSIPTDKLNTFEGYSDATKHYIRDHPASFLSISKVDLYKNRWPLDTLIVAYNSLAENYKSTKVGIEVNSFILKRKNTNTGTMARNFVTRDIHGNKISLDNFKGKYLLIDFWGSWCVPCRQSMPHVKALYAKYKNKGLSVLAIAHEYESSDKAWKDAIKKDGTNMFIQARTELVNDKTDQSLSDKYFVTLFPTKFLIDPQGKIIGKYLGTEDDKKLDEQLKEIFR